MTAIGSRTPAFTVTVERGRLRFFAKAIGERDAVYTDLAAAEQAGHRDLPVPPTFLFCLEMDRPDPMSFLTDAGVDPARVLHGSQRFTYHAMAYAGDRLTFESHITDDYEKKGGLLRFLVRETRVTRDNDPIATLNTVAIVRAAQEAP